MSDYIYSNGELYHWGVKGMKWGVRRFQNKNGSLTPAGKKRYEDKPSREEKKAAKTAAKEAKKNSPEAIAKRMQRQETIEKGKQFIKANGKSIALGVGTAAAMALGMHYLTPIINSAANVKLATDNKQARLDAMDDNDFVSRSRQADSSGGNDAVRRSIATDNKQRRLDAMDDMDYTSSNREAIAARGSAQVTSNKQDRIDAMESLDILGQSRTAQVERILADQAFEDAANGRELTDYQYDILRRMYTD